ncbi:thiamine pyrophosphate-binding protein [Enemella evansiae]|uniref:thiamine pyrophosphate-binding protein n=1 Tax=Enemella evansiae TaxID=2016499 RepID=UPI000B95E323|nr:thiamine pyrophosphate-binding protein [Enemella evansiae]OYO06035.1 thiamine pyrophosphate-binding protein [Enemella evansiae]
MTTDSPTVATALADQLAEHVDTVFGVLGNGNAHVIDALLRHPVTWVSMRHEAGTVAAADAYHRASGRLALATTTYGPGFTNAATSLTEARMARIPLLLVTAQAPTGGLRPWDIDQVALADVLGVPTLVLSTDNVAAMVQQAVATALTEKTPVVIALPYDLIEQRVSPAALDAPATDQQAAPAPRTLTADTLEELVTALRGAQRPVVLAGRGAVPAAESVRRLAAAVGALAVTSAPARGLFTGYELDAGVAGGFASERTAELIHRADLALVLGAGLNQFTMSFGETFAADSTVWQLDEQDAVTNPRVDHFASADVGAAAGQLLEALATEPGPVSGGWDPAQVAGAQFDRDPGAELAPDGQLDPRSLTRRLDEILPADRIVTLDGGHFVGWPNTYLELSDERSLHWIATAFQSIGLGLQAAVGIAHARPDRLLAVFSGDGGALMCAADLETLVRESRRTVVVIYNDAAYGAEIHQYGARGINTTPMLIPQVDFAGMARALGAQAEVIRRLEDLKGLADWVTDGADGLYLVDCRISPDVVAPYIQEIIQKTLVRE